MIDGRTEVLAVIGDPIAHTFSPMLHKIFIEKAGLNQVYVPFHVKPEGLAASIQGAWNLGIAGMNVTIPHKQEVMKQVIRISDEAVLTGAVNTLRWTEQGYEGYNTDVYGFSKLVENAGVDIFGKKVLIIGAGGAAKSAITYAILKKASEIAICNRTAERAENLMKEFQNRAANAQIEVPDMRTVDGVDLSNETFPIVFQTTAAGMSPHVDEIPAVIQDERFYDGVLFIADMVYNPRVTRLCKEASIRGIPAVTGLPMLFYQGLRSFEIWTGVSFTDEDTESMFRQFEEEMEKRNG